MIRSTETLTALDGVDVFPLVKKKIVLPREIKGKPFFPVVSKFVKPPGHY